MRSLSMGFVSIVVLFALIAASASAATDDAGLGKSMSVNLKEAPVEQAYQLFAQMADAELELASNAGGSVNLVLDHVTLRTILNAFCESVNCRWSIEPGDPRVLRFESNENELTAARALAEQTRVSLNFERESAGQVFERLSRALGTKLAAYLPADTDTVTIDKEAPVSELLDEICRDLQCQWRLVGPSPVTLEVTPAPPGTRS